MSHFKVYWPDDDRNQSHPQIRLAVFDDEFENHPSDEPQILSFANYRRGSNGRIVANHSATRTWDRGTMRDN